MLDYQTGLQGSVGVCQQHEMRQRIDNWFLIEQRNHPPSSWLHLSSVRLIRTILHSWKYNFIQGCHMSLRLFFCKKQRKVDTGLLSVGFVMQWGKKETGAVKAESLTAELWVPQPLGFYCCFYDTQYTQAGTHTNIATFAPTHTSQWRCRDL